MTTSRTTAAATVFGSLVSAVAHAATPAPIALLPETVTLKPSDLPGHAIAVQKCGICHSADYIAYQPPAMTLAQWTGEMTKMQKLYGAPISDDEVRLLGVYLAAADGDAKTVTEADRALVPVATVAAAAPSAANAPDVQTLLTDNGCLACHALDHAIVGPGFRDIAGKYQADPQAAHHVGASIRAGGSGKWGQVPMPPFANLSAGDAKVLAEYVLEQ